MGDQERDIWITAGNRRLRGTLHRPEMAAAQIPAVIGIHGLLSNRQSQKQIALAQSCVARGMAYLRFDHRGCGDSEGHLATDTSLSARMLDLKAAWDTLTRQAWIDAQRIGLFGSSFGGTVALAVAARNTHGAVVTLAAPLNSRPLMELAGTPAAQSIPSTFFTPRHEFDLTPRIPTVTHLLTCHGKADEIVPVAHARKIHGLAGKPKELLLFPKGDHRISTASHREMLLRQTVSWFDRHL